MRAAPIAVVALVVLGFVALGYIQGRWTWGGTGFEGASLWNWLDLLIVPVILGIGGIWLQRTQRRRELEIAEQQAQDNALQAYLDLMSQLLINKEGKQLLQLDPDIHVRRLMAAQTSTVLERLDKGRTLAIVRFLAEAHLISKPHPVVSLVGADLSGIDFKGVDLRDGDLRGANLSNADLSGANIGGADLRGATLVGAVITGAQLEHVRLSETHLSEVEGLTQEQLDRTIGDEDTLLPEYIKRPKKWADKGSNE